MVQTANYNAENICRALGLAGFANDWQLASATRGIRVLLAPSFHPEVCISVVDNGNDITCTVLTARSQIWRQGGPGPIPTPTYSASGTFTTEQFDELAVLLKEVAKPVPPRRVVILDGVRAYSVIRANGQGIANINEVVSSNAAYDEFLRRFITEAWHAIDEPRVRNALRDVGVNVAFPEIQVPPEKTSIRTLVLGPEGAVDDVLGALKKLHEERQPVASASPQLSLLRQLVRHCDAILLDVLEVVGQQVVAKPVVVYAKRFEGAATYSVERLSFVGAPGSWGNVTLKPGERALVFLKRLHGGRLYQHHWHGHFTVTEINGTLHAVANWDLLQSGKPWEPSGLFDAAFYPNAEKKWQVAMPYALLERHLEDELRSIDK